MKNKFEIRGDVTAIFIRYKGKVYETLISTNKLNVADSFKGTWYGLYMKNTDSLYVLGTIYGNGSKKAILLHRWIMNARDGYQIDHIDHDTLNNTDNNLTEVTQSVNLQNRKSNQSNNSSGFRGVSFHKRLKKWSAYYAKNGRLVHLGYFEDKHEAAAVAQKARIENFEAKGGIL